MKASYLALGLVLTFGFCTGMPDKVHAEDTARNQMPFSQALEVIRTKHNVPGLAAAACIDGRIVDIGATGVRSVGSEEKVTVEDRWHIGSCTKSMTASLAAMLVEEGRVRWETTVGEILNDTPELNDRWRTVTLEQLFQHRAGAPEVPPAPLWAAAWEQTGTPLQQRRNFVFGLLRTPPETAPGTHFQYSNQGYSIAGAMLEQIMGKPWEDLMRERLFNPLGMQSAGFGAPHPNQPLGHIGKRPPLKPQKFGPDADNPAAIGPGGTVHCSIADFARYAAWHATAGKGEKPHLKPDSFTRLHQPATGGDYAMGWFVAKRTWAGGQVLTHNGSNTMWYAVMWVAPEKNAAFVAATNAASNTAALACDDSVAELIGRTLTGK